MELAPWGWSGLAVGSTELRCVGGVDEVAGAADVCGEVVDVRGVRVVRVGERRLAGVERAVAGLCAVADTAAVDGVEVVLVSVESGAVPASGG
jgi:hypothetical protein